MIRLRDVVKTYRPLFGAPVRALDAVSLDVAPGEVLGIAGPNGAGKSTLISLLLGFHGPSAGHVAIDGLPPRRYVERHGVGYAPEGAAAVPRRWRAREALVRYAVLAGVPAASLGAEVDALLDRLGLAEHQDKRVSALSKGTLQRLVVAQALLGRPRLHIFDEPTSGLDPLWVQRFRAVVEALREPGHTVLVASHDLDELARVADRVIILDRGRLQRVVATRGAHLDATTFVVTVAAGMPALLAAFAGARALGDDRAEVRVRDLRDLNASLANAIAAGALVAGVAPARPALEDEYRQAVGAVGEEG